MIGWRPVTVTPVAVVIAAGALSACGARALAKPPTAVQSLHLRATTGSMGNDFVFVEPVEAGVRIRAVRVENANRECPSLVVQAVERVVPATTVQALAGTPVCSMTAARVEAAHREAPYRGGDLVDFIGSIEALIAQCGGEERGFTRIAPPLVDDTVLHQRTPDVAALWDLLPRLQHLALDSREVDAFAGASPAVQAQREALGTALVPTLLQGRYGPYLRRVLADYTGPPAERDAVVPEVLERGTLPLAHYVRPVMPQIALSARVFGTVRLRLLVDRASGAVRNVVVLDGPPLLGSAATTAATAWRFTPGALAADEIVVSIRFQRRC